MKHAASRELYAYWEEKRGTRPAPERAEIEPGAIRGVLSDAFILAIDRSAGHPIRLAGTRVCALFDREIKGEAFLNLWSAASRPIIGSLLAILTDECTGTVAGVTAQNANGESIELELLLLPLGTRRPSFARAIGVLAPLKVPPWLGVEPNRCAHARRAPACRGGARETSTAALYDTTTAAWSDGLRRRTGSRSGQQAK